MFFYGSYITFPMANIVSYPYPTFFNLNEVHQEKNLNLQQKQTHRIQESKQLQTSILEDELRKRHIQSKSKLWTEEEDQLLMKMANQKKDWSQITQQFPEKTLFVCQRRYKRLLKQNEKWPKQNEDRIKYLYEVEKLPWRQIQKFMPKYTKKQIKQRYKNFLEVQVKRALWTVEEDLKLWKLVNEFGHSWVKFTKSLPGRSQLQLKNRYNKFIKPLQNRLFKAEEAQSGSEIRGMEEGEEADI